MLFVGIDSWIIQDGNYGDFRVGDNARFALEFYPRTLAPASSRGPSLDRIRACEYRMCGKVIFSGPSAWVIDFGWMAFQQHIRPMQFNTGDWVEGDIYLGIDPFMYVEELQSLPGMPALQYDWRIAAFHLETTPWISQKADTGATLLTRDEQRQSFIEVAETDAWSDDDGRAHYVLACERQALASDA